MILKFIHDCDTINYKYPSLFIGFSKCSGKCDIENRQNLCHGTICNYYPNVDMSYEEIYDMYKKSMFNKSVVCGGLEPFDDFKELYNLIKYFRDNNENCNFVIYTGYTEEEITSGKSEYYKFASEWIKIFEFNNIVIKYGRFVPFQNKHLDKVLGVSLASDNQYAKEYNVG